MLYHLFYRLHEVFSGLNIFRYITFRAALATLTAFFISLIFGPLIIKKLKGLNIGEKINKADSRQLDELHRAKHGTPTMGGLLILLAIVSSTLLWADILNRYVLIVLAATIWLGLTGFCDDYLKQARARSKGLPAAAKITSQAALGLCLGLFLLWDSPNNIMLDVPFLKDTVLNLDGLYVLFVILVIVGSSNAVNLTDGLDGLAVGIVVMVALAFSVLSYVSGNAKISAYLLIPYVKGAGELTVFCAGVIGAGLGFLWFNCHPAAIFMGDVGSLALGGALGAVALIIKKELLLALVGGIFVVEALSVILQVASFRLTGKRVFKCSPLHHHFQFQGWPENKIIVRFWIIAALLALATIVTVKVR
jgi:phospho-N-acetylmuramoyl-pentapeptide-transferase